MKYKTKGRRPLNPAKGSMTLWKPLLCLEKLRSGRRGSAQIVLRAENGEPERQPGGAYAVQTQRDAQKKCIVKA